MGCSKDGDGAGCAEEVGFIRLEMAGEALARWTEVEAWGAGTEAPVKAGYGSIVIAARIGSYLCPLEAGRVTGGVAFEERSSRSI